MDEPLPVAKAAEVLLEFLKGGSLTNTIAQLEYELEGQAVDTTHLQIQDLGGI